MTKKTGTAVSELSLSDIASIDLSRLLNIQNDIEVKNLFKKAASASLLAVFALGELIVTLDSTVKKHQDIIAFLCYPLSDKGIGNVTYMNYTEQFVKFSSDSRFADRENTVILGKVKASSSTFIVCSTFSALDYAITEGKVVQDVKEKANAGDTRFIERIGTASKESKVEKASTLDDIL